MKKLITALILTSAVLVGCTAGTTGGETETCGTTNPEITLVTDTGGVNDKSFNQGSWEGVQEYCLANDLNADYIETGDLSELEKNLDTAADQSEIVVASGFNFSEPLYKAAVDNPDTDFVLIDAEPIDENGDPATLDNVQSYYFNEVQAGYLVGYIAAATSETDHIGFVGGQKIPPVERFGYGYILGAQAYNPDVTIEYNYTGSFTDATLGKETANTMIDKGADVVFTCAGGVNAGVVQAGVDENVNNPDKATWIIGVDIDMYDDGLYKNDAGEETSVILTSAVKGVGIAAQSGLADHFDGNFSGGVEVLDYSNGGVGIPEENPNLEGKESIVTDAESALEEAGDLPQSSDEVEAELEDTVTINGEY